MSREIAEDGNKIWLETVTGMTPYERKEKLNQRPLLLEKRLQEKQ